MKVGNRSYRRWIGWFGVWVGGMVFAADAPTPAAPEPAPPSPPAARRREPRNVPIELPPLPPDLPVRRPGPGTNRLNALPADRPGGSNIVRRYQFTNRTTLPSDTGFVVGPPPFPALDRLYPPPAPRPAYPPPTNVTRPSPKALANYPLTHPLPPPIQEKAFAWDALVKEYKAKTGELSAKFTFALTNISGTNVTIHYVRTSCGCTVAKLPSVPWLVPADSNGTFEVTADLRGKMGTITKTITVDCTAGYRILSLRISVPPSSIASTSPADRMRNLQISMADRQAVFRDNCAVCHLQPGIGKSGEALYYAVCGVCHEAEHRASMVPNLRAVNRPKDPEFWRPMIIKGKLNSLMPAFARTEGGPLTDEQVQSVVDFMIGPYQTLPPLTHPSNPLLSITGAVPAFSTNLPMASLTNATPSPLRQ